MGNDIKEFRKKIRQCKNEDELKDLIYNFTVEESKAGRYHYHPFGAFRIKRWGSWEYAETCDIWWDERDGRITVYLPPAWKCSFKDIKQFSYNFKFFMEDKNGYFLHY